MNGDGGFLGLSKRHNWRLWVATQMFRAASALEFFTIGIVRPEDLVVPRPLRQSRDALRLQAEHTYLEKSATSRDRPVGVYYTSRAVLQGYTHDGRVLGAAIGPGASSHWLAVDYFGFYFAPDE